MTNFFKNKIALFSLAIVCIIISLFLFSRIYSNRDLKHIALKLENKLNEKEEEINALTNTYIKEVLQNGYWNETTEVKMDWQEYFTKKGLALLLFENDSLVFWSSNAIPINVSYIDSRFNKPIIKLKNGWYRVLSSETKITATKTLHALKLILIKQEYTYENKYLTNRFQPGFQINQPIDILVDSLRKDARPIYSSNREYLFSIKETTSSAFKATNFMLPILFFIGLLLLVRFLWILKDEPLINLSAEIRLGIYMLVLIALRLGMMFFQFPFLLYSSTLFDPSVFADTSLFPSLGDLFINALLFFHFSYLFYKKIDLQAFFQRLDKKFQLGLSFFLVHTLVFFFLFTLYIVKSLITNSTLILNPNQINQFSAYSLWALAIIGIHILSVFLIADKCVFCVTRVITSRPHLLVLCASVFLWFLLPIVYLFKLSAISIIIGYVFFVRSRKQFQYTFPRALFLLILVSLLYSRIIAIANQQKEKNQRLYLAEQLVIKQDFNAEALFNEIQKQLISDSVVNLLLISPEENNSKIQQHINKKYFSGYWKKYEVRIMACHEIDTLFIQPENIQKRCFDFFIEKVKSFGSETTSPNLYFLKSGRGRVSYLSILPIMLKESKDTVHLFFEIDSKFIPEGLGYPELLLDFETKVGMGSNSDYSYARYSNDTLLNHSGKFIYDRIQPLWAKLSQNHNFISVNKYSHLLFQLPDKSTILLSKKEDKWAEILAYFSYTLILFALIFLGGLVIYYSPTFKNRLVDLKTRVQLSMSLVLVLSLLLLGGGAINYIKRIYHNRNIDVLSEKVYSVLTELEHKLGQQKELTIKEQDRLAYYLEKFSNVFFTDINLYDLDGNLIASSRSKIFNEGLIGNKINPIAFRKLAMEQKNLFIQEENIGSMNYLSAYIPFLNIDNKPIAYLNLPYFAKQTEIQNEVSGFVVTMLNSFVLLFVFAIAVALFISNRLTRPLSILQEKMKEVQLGERNEFIEWKGDDEIGKLVKAYNSMIAELTKSAEMLAKSERESAWKEMARQVAHEIKNPLTPMKLSVQQLQRAWNDKAVDLDERIKKFSSTMIEQIDTLSSIATSFSNFAKMPIANFEKVDLINVIENTAHLFRSEDHIEISIINELIGQATVFADKEQLSRVFNNIIKNACQAIYSDQKGKISIHVNEEGRYYLVSISDNGCGIAVEKKHKIFEPNFTTKSSGTGLGLAMSKNSIESFKGSIRFESEEGKGTTFFIRLPVFEEKI